MKFEIEKRLEGQPVGGLARAGRIETTHGVIETPALIVAATKATVKALAPEDLHALGVEAVLANTYHLYLQPGDELVKRAGGLHKFMNWAGPIITDSGGFQAFSLGEALGHGISKFTSWIPPELSLEPKNLKPNNLKPARFDDDGVTFYSHIDGSEHRFTPERSIEIQHNLGADIIFAFDECVSPHASRQAHEKAVARTTKWAERCVTAHKRVPCSLLGTRYPNALFGVVQGGRYEDLRRRSAKEIAALEFEGFGIGGSFVKEDISSAVRAVCEELPEGKPRHLLGVGEPLDILAGVENGVDTFDCVAATRKARNGQLYTSSGEVSITGARFRECFESIDKECRCYTCQNFTAAYLHHLVKSRELLAYRLATIHNLHFIIDLMKNIRASILKGDLFEFSNNFRQRFSPEG